MVWTTTPWTLLSNTGVAVNPELTYAVVDGHVVAEELVDAVFGEGASARVSQRLPGSALVGLRYVRPFDDVDAPPGADGWRVVPADYVTTDEGTGSCTSRPPSARSTARSGGSTACRRSTPSAPTAGSPRRSPGWPAADVRASRTATSTTGSSDAGLLIRRAPYVHSYPHCWRCRTLLIYWGKPSWYVATSTRKDDLLAANATIDWHPEHIRDGRFGEWLANNVDWALSRDRYWGTPLPVWRCGRGHLRCVGLARRALGPLRARRHGIDPHRPAIDEVTFACSSCAAEGRRRRAGGLSPCGAGHRRVVRLGVDARGPDGATRTSAGSAEAFTFPADFIAEAIDQTRGWFYSLLAVNTLVFGESPYRHVVCLGHIVDEDGRKMSKSLGNIIDPWSILDTRGADAMRWWMFSQGSPWTPTRATLAAIDTAMRDMLADAVEHVQLLHDLRLAERLRPGRLRHPCAGDRSPLDRWILSRLASTTPR